MTEGDAGFTGSIPQLYDRHLGALLFAPYADDLARRLADVMATAPAVSRLLEVAAGTGIATSAIAARLPATVEITATDLNQPMLDYAATKRIARSVSWKQADALALPFPDDTFDIVACQFGIMFFPDRVAGMREMHRVLRPGGKLVFSVWDRLASNPILQAVVDGLSRRYPHHPSWFLDRTPCGYRNPDQIRADLEKAGFRDCRIETVSLTSQSSSPHDPAVGMCQGSPMRAEIEALDPAGLDAATQAATDEVARRFGEGPFPVELQALVVEARR